MTAEFVHHFLKPRQKRWQATEAIINNKLIARWRGRPIRQITKPDVLKLLDREMDAGRQRMANQSHQLAGQLFRWALQRGYIDQAPTAGIDRPCRGLAGSSETGLVCSTTESLNRNGDLLRGWRNAHTMLPHRASRDKEQIRHTSCLPLLLRNKLINQHGDRLGSWQALIWKSLLPWPDWP